jgi:hypothetical protein
MMSTRSWLQQKNYANANASNKTSNKRRNGVAKRVRAMSEERANVDVISKNEEESVTEDVVVEARTSEETGTRKRAQKIDAMTATTTASTTKCRLVSNIDNCFTVEGTIVLLSTSAEDVYNMLTDYENASKVFPSTVKKVEYLGKNGDQKRIRQTCNWKFFIFGGNFNIELGVVENDEKKHMACSLEGGNQKKFGFLREFVGTWEVEKISETETKVTHVLMVKPSLTPPYASDIFVKQVEGILKDVEKEVNSWNANGYGIPTHRL